MVSLRVSKRHIEDGGPFYMVALKIIRLLCSTFDRTLPTAYLRDLPDRPGHELAHRPSSDYHVGQSGCVDSKMGFGTWKGCNIAHFCLSMLSWMPSVLTAPGGLSKLDGHAWKGQGGQTWGAAHPAM